MRREEQDSQKVYIKSNRFALFFIISVVNFVLFMNVPSYEIKRAIELLVHEMVEITWDSRDRVLREKLASELTNRLKLKKIIAPLKKISAILTSFFDSQGIGGFYTHVKNPETGVFEKKFVFPGIRLQREKRFSEGT